MPFPFSPPQGESAPVGNATAGDVLSPNTFSSAAAGVGVIGTMPNQGSPTWNPSTSTQSLAAGYYSGGTINPVSGTATAGDVRSGVTFSSGSGIGLTGTMPNQGSPTITPTTSSQSLSAGYYGGVTINAVPAASGTVTSSSTQIPFSLQGGDVSGVFESLTSLNSYYVNISYSLPAAPKVIILTAAVGSAAQYDNIVYSSPGGFYTYPGGGTGVVLEMYNWGNQTSEFQLYVYTTGGSLSVTSTGATLPCSGNGVSYNWIAIL